MSTLDDTAGCPLRYMDHLLTHSALDKERLAGRSRVWRWSLIGTSRAGRRTHVYMTEEKEGGERRVRKKDRNKRRE